MTGVGLIKALSARVEAAAKNYKFEADNHPDKPVSVYRQYIPKSHLENRQGQYHPLIVVSLVGLEDDDETIADVNLTFGVYGESDDTWLDLINLMETVRIDLLSKPDVGRRYRLQMPLRMEISEMQPSPFFYGLIEARYWLASPAEEGRDLSGWIQTRSIRD